MNLTLNVDGVCLFDLVHQPTYADRQVYPEAVLELIRKIINNLPSECSLIESGQSRDNFRLVRPHDLQQQTPYNRNFDLALPEKYKDFRIYEALQELQYQTSCSLHRKNVRKEIRFFFLNTRSAEEL